MKKFLLFAMCLAAVSVFAEPFSLSEYNKILKEKGWGAVKKYCYEASMSTETNYQQAYAYINYYKRDLNDNKITKQQLLQVVNKFKPYINEKGIKELTSYYLASAGYQKQALQIRQHLAVYIALVNYFYEVRNYEKHWEYAQKILLTNGGLENDTMAYDILIKMFRFKPDNVTTEQQVEFLTKLSEIYPIPGTDFNKWKGFMGFVGFKYKALTKKNLF